MDNDFRNWVLKSKESAAERDAPRAHGSAREWQAMEADEFEVEFIYDHKQA